MQSILFTGGSGFVGVNIKPVLEAQNYIITSIGNTHFDDIEVDIAKEIPVLNKRHEIILHAAGKAHSVPKDKTEEQSFFDVNLQGTKNLCSALEQYGLPESFIFISTVAVYGCEFGENITEGHPLNGNTPYALSKKYAEQYLTEWCKKNNIILSILRPSLIAGKNPPGNLGAMIRGIESGCYLSIAGGKVHKSILMANDIANLVPKLVNAGGGIYNVCDDEHPTFEQLEILISRQLGKHEPNHIPYWLAKSMATIGDVFGNKFPINSSKLDKITQSLTFSNTKAKDNLNWKPLNVLENFKIF
jgi:nucleoside-diphosphate-sugar epimerase